MGKGNANGSWDPEFLAARVGLWRRHQSAVALYRVTIGDEVIAEFEPSTSVSEEIGCMVQNMAEAAGSPVTVRIEAMSRSEHGYEPLQSMALRAMPAPPPQADNSAENALKVVLSGFDGLQKQVVAMTTVMSQALESAGRMQATLVEDSGRREMALREENGKLHELMRDALSIAAKARNEAKNETRGERLERIIVDAVADRAQTMVGAFMANATDDAPDKPQAPPVNGNGGTA